MKMVYSRKNNNNLEHTENSGMEADDRNFNGGMRDKNALAGAGLSPFDRWDAGLSFQIDGGTKAQRSYT